MPLIVSMAYGNTKLVIELMLRDLVVADSEWSVAILRYFNSIGVHASDLIGEDPSGILNNLMPYIIQVTVGKLPKLLVFGCNYPTRDGTCERDYIHVMDLATGHLKALEKVLSSTGVEVYNLGTGKGYSVLEVIRIFEKISGQQIPYQIVERRPGDLPVSYANAGKAKKELGWVAQRDIAEMCRDSWNWQLKNPSGYRA